MTTMLPKDVMETTRREFLHEGLGGIAAAAKHPVQPALSGCREAE